MNAEKTICKNEIVLIIDQNLIDDALTDEILKISSNFKKTGLDMKNVKSIRSEKFIKALLSDKFRLFNAKNEILTFLSIILKDGFLKSFMNKNDFEENKRELVKRRFLVA